VAEERSLDHEIDPDATLAIEVDTTFVHEAHFGEDSTQEKLRKRDRAKAKVKAIIGRDASSGKAESDRASEIDEEKETKETVKDPFRLEAILLSVPRGE
jgi:hypothetical protein